MTNAHIKAAVFVISKSLCVSSLYCSLLGSWQVSSKYQTLNLRFCALTGQDVLSVSVFSFGSKGIVRIKFDRVNSSSCLWLYFICTLSNHSWWRVLDDRVSATQAENKSTLTPVATEMPEILLNSYTSNRNKATEEERYQTFDLGSVWINSRI